jgi:hypothetical protein
MHDCETRLALCVFGTRPNGSLELYGSLELFGKNNAQRLGALASQAVGGGVRAPSSCCLSRLTRRAVLIKEQTVSLDNLSNEFSNHCLSAIVAEIALHAPPSDTVACSCSMRLPLEGQRSSLPSPMPLLAWAGK